MLPQRVGFLEIETRNTRQTCLVKLALLALLPEAAVLERANTEASKPVGLHACLALSVRHRLCK